MGHILAERGPLPRGSLYSSAERGGQPRALSLITSRVVFVLLAYSLIQIYLTKIKREDLNPKTPLRIRRQLLPSDNHLIVCWKNFYALFAPYEYTELILSFGPTARRKLAEKSRRMSRQFQEGLRNPRSP